MRATATVLMIRSRRTTQCARSAADGSFRGKHVMPQGTPLRRGSSPTNRRSPARVPHENSALRPRGQYAIALLPSRSRGPARRGPPNNKRGVAAGDKFAQENRKMIQEDISSLEYKSDAQERRRYSIQLFVTVMILL